MAVPLAAIGAGVSALGALKGVFGGRGGGAKARRRAVSALRAARPTGYLLPEDYRAAELTRGRLTEGVARRGQLEGYEIGRRYQARGLAGSPAEERTRARLQTETLLGAQHAGESAEEQLYKVKTGREAFDREKELAIFGAEAGEAARQSSRDQAQTGAFWNSLNEFIPTIMTSLRTGAAPAPGAANTTTGRPSNDAYTPAGYDPDVENLFSTGR
jgi:hypothetical protein